MWVWNPWTTENVSLPFVACYLKIFLAALWVLQLIWGVALGRMVWQQAREGEFRDNVSGDTEALRKAAEKKNTSSRRSVDASADSSATEDIHSADKVAGPRRRVAWEGFCRKFLCRATCEMIYLVPKFELGETFYSRRSSVTDLVILLFLWLAVLNWLSAKLFAKKKPLFTAVFKCLHTFRSYFKLAQIAIYVGEPSDFASDLAPIFNMCLW